MACHSWLANTISESLGISVNFLFLLLLLHILRMQMRFCFLDRQRNGYHGKAQLFKLDQNDPLTHSGNTNIVISFSDQAAGLLTAACCKRRTTLVI